MIFRRDVQPGHGVAGCWSWVDDPDPVYFEAVDDDDEPTAVDGGDPGPRPSPMPAFAELWAAGNPPLHDVAIVECDSESWNPEVLERFLAHYRVRPQHVPAAARAFLREAVAASMPGYGLVIVE